MKSFFKKLNAILIAVTLAASSIFSGASYAATQGTLGATSTGSVDISVTKASQARISGLSDLTIAAYSVGDGNQAMASTVCIYSSTSGGGYTVTASGDGTASAFTLASGTDLLTYTIVWNSGGAGALGTSGAALLTTIASASLTNASTSSSDCDTGANPTAQLNVNITGAALDAAPAGIYTGTLTLLVTPV